MDLRSIINNEAGEGARQKQAAGPGTPIQAPPPPQSFRDYSHAPHGSPGSHPSHEYGPDTPKTRGSYASPTLSQDQRAFSNRPPPPAPSQSDLRSPAGSFSAQSPYRQSVSTLMSNQYPFPQHQVPQSPSQHHQYPPNFQPRDSHSQPTPAPPHLQTNISQNQASSIPQTPPIGIPGAPHPYLQQQHQQRSQSAASTPTSAHSQSQYFNQHPQESPVSASAGQFPPSQIPTHQRQQSLHSQPGTPIGTPITQRPPSGSFVQPTSPYQQRGLSAGPFSQFRTSPAPPSVSTPKLPSTPGGYDSQRTSASDQQRRSQGERERSMSVSPKTRPPGQAGDKGDNSDRPPPPEDNSITSVKRKMEDREAHVEQPQRIGQTDIKPQINGTRRTPSGSSSSPKQPPRKRTRYVEPPIWAQSIIGRSKSILVPAKVNHRANGTQGAAKAPVQAVPPPTKADINGHNQGPPLAGQVEDPSRILGPWEKSITGKKPFEQMTKIIADWLYVNVVSRNDLGELASRGVEVEIEAKIGQLIDKDTSQRFTLPVLSECILAENPRIGFKSSMTEAQHRSLNDFLNQRVAEAHPQNPEALRRVPIDYLHRRETDKFYELPTSHHASLPPAVRERLNTRHPVKVRVTYAQDPKEPKTILAKIIKARIADIDIYNPQSPLDCRISINFEMRYDGDVEELKAISIDSRIPDRNKDRLSYKQSHYQVDLTQVTQLSLANGVNRTDKEHELEIEISTVAIREQGQRAAAGEANEYVSLVEGFLDNMRVLARAVPPP